jgi:type IV secretion system protein TrbL
MAGVASGLGGVARAGAGAAAQSVKRAAGSAGETMAESYRGGARIAVEATGGTSTMGSIGGSAASEGAPATSSPPAWAQRMKRHQTMSHGATAAAHAVKSGDSYGGGASVSLRQDDR